NKPYEKESVDLKKIVASLREIFYNKIKDKVEIVIEIEENFTLEANIGFVTQILLNLISNSIDAIKDNGIIKVIAKNNEQKKYVIVSDNGTGIPGENIENIFNAFFTTKEVGKGTGLGLYIVKDMVMKLNWQINVRSELNKGTDFIITI
ncbi:MAG TPA: HAMP domain-containing sensor histidine kinase, partial [Spirochaetota bacterium]|nr:HAMP domain-containing sensor histidine kinase [Spirochaetota bacterium]